MREEKCQQVLALRELFKRERGYSMFGRGEFIKQKAGLVYDGYIRMPCARIYDATDTYYCDIYWYKLVTVDEVRNASLYPSNSIFPPPGWDPAVRKGPERTRGSADSVVHEANDGQDPNEDDLLCNQEGFTGELPGGCRRYGDIFPLSSVELFGLSMSVPRAPAKSLSLAYGDDWMIPQPKGYKALVCKWAPSQRLATVLLVFTVAVCCFQLWRRCDVFGTRSQAGYHPLSKSKPDSAAELQIEIGHDHRHE